MVLHYRVQSRKLQVKFPEWFPTKVVPKGEAYIDFRFDAKEIFNRFARSDDAWDELQRDGTINVDGFFDYLVNDPQVFRLVEEEFNLYKHHRRNSTEDGDEPRGWMRHMFYSLTQQLVRQDPAYWTMVAAARPDQNWRLASYPY
ncbi:MAG: hypothetical protein M1840_008128 [Geoglossum simile]|nr:MAG: hypothetical protein M1840_008128 [Geoglossum simile]